MAKSNTQSFEDSATMKLVLETHSPDAEHKINVTPVLGIIDNILSRAIPSIDSALAGTHENGLLEEKSSEAVSTAAFGDLAFVINKVFCELTCKCSTDAHTTTMEILQTLSKYSWEAKAVLTIAAFAVNYGEFGLFAQLYFANPLAKYIALLKQLPEIIEHGQSLKPQFDAITTLLKAVVELTKCIVGFNDLNPKYVSPDKPPMSVLMADIHKPVYWIIHSVVACATQISSITGFTEGPAPTYSISNLAVRVNSKLKVIQAQYDLCEKHIVEEKQKEDYEKVVNVFKVPQLDNILSTVFNLDKSGAQTLVDSSGQKVGIEVFLQKTVLILVSNIDITLEEITILGNFYVEGKKRPDLQYHIVWLPIVDTETTTWEKIKVKFEELRKHIPWYTVKDPSLIKPEVIKYIKQEWKYSGKKILVPLDSKGKVQSYDALHMLWMWGNSAFPFTESKERDLSLEPSSPLDLIFGGIENSIVNLIKKGEVTICFYGGDDLEWIKRFTTVVKKLAEVVGITIELIYVGKSTGGDKVKKNIAHINSHKIGHYWTETSIWLFWTRVKSILFSKTRLNVTTELMEEVITLLSFDGSDKGWSLFCKGSSMAKAKGDVDVVLAELLRNEEWKANAKKIDFVAELDIHFKKLHNKHCNRFFLNAELPGDVHCYCGRSMQKSIVYCCCVDN